MSAGGDTDKEETQTEPAPSEAGYATPSPSPHRGLAREAPALLGPSRQQPHGGYLAAICSSPLNLVGSGFHPQWLHI